MKPRQSQTSSDSDRRVIKFRPRGGVEVQERLDASRPPAPSNDLSRYERGRDEPDDFRHRMVANAAAGAFAVALTAIGIWLAMSIADIRKTQDCVLMGRRDCAGIGSTAG